MPVFLIGSDMGITFCFHDMVQFGLMEAGAIWILPFPPAEDETGGFGPWRVWGGSWKLPEGVLQMFYHPWKCGEEKERDTLPSFAAEDNGNDKKMTSLSWNYVLAVVCYTWSRPVYCIKSFILNY